MYNTIYTINTTKIIHKSSAIGIHNGPKHHIQGIDITPVPLNTHNIAVINITTAAKKQYKIHIIKANLFYTLFC